MRLRKGDAAIFVFYLIVLLISLLSLKSSGDILTVETENGTYAYSLSENGVYDFRPNLLRPIFRKQRNIDFFMQAKVLYGTVVWPDDSDISPEHLYEKSTLINVKCLRIAIIRAIDINIQFISG